MMAAVAFVRNLVEQKGLCLACLLLNAVNINLSMKFEQQLWQRLELQHVSGIALQHFDVDFLTHAFTFDSRSP